jgi:hypothetical protein
MPSGDSLPEIFVALSPENSPISIPEVHFRGISPDRLVAFMLDSDDMEPAMCKGDVIVIDAGQTNLPVGGTGEPFVISFGPNDMECYPRFCFRPVSASPDVMIYAPNPKKVPPRLRDPENVRIIGKVVWLHRDFKISRPE